MEEVRNRRVSISRNKPAERWRQGLRVPTTPHEAKTARELSLTRICRCRDRRDSSSCNCRARPILRRDRCKSECGCTRTALRSKAVPSDQVLPQRTVPSSEAPDRDPHDAWVRESRGTSSFQNCAFDCNARELDLVSIPRKRRRTPHRSLTCLPCCFFANRLARKR
jgi:hypothetical protein